METTLELVWGRPGFRWSGVCTWEKVRMSMRYRAVLFLGRAFVREIGEGIDSVINWFDADIHVLYLLFTAHTACIQTQYF